MVDVTSPVGVLFLVAGPPEEQAFIKDLVSAYDLPLLRQRPNAAAPPDRAAFPVRAERPVAADRAG